MPAGRLRVTHAGEEIANGVVNVGHEVLPGGFGYTGDIPVAGQFAEADAADSKESHESMAAATQVAAVIDARGVDGLFALCLGLKEGLETQLLPMDNGLASHEAV